MNEKINEEKAKNLISYYEDSAYVKSTDLRDYAADLMKEEFPFSSDFTIEEFEQWEENIKPAEEEIFEFINEMILNDYDYIELEYQGDYHRYIWHEKIIMKKSEIIENLKSQNVDCEEFEVNTDYEDQETGEYLEAVATLRINVDGTHEIMKYSYYDCENNLHDTFEYDWDINSVERTFKIEIDC